MADYNVREKTLNNEDDSIASTAIESLVDLCNSIKKQLTINTSNALSTNTNINVGSLNAGSLNTTIQNIRRLTQVSKQSLNIFRKYSNLVNNFIGLTNKLNPFKNLGEQNNILERTKEITSQISGVLRNTDSILKSTLSITKTIGKLREKQFKIDLKKKAVGIKNAVIAKLQAFWAKVQSGFTKLTLALKTKKLIIAKKLLIGFAKILIPVLAIVAAVKIIMAIVRALRGLFGGGRNSGAEYKPKNYSGVRTNQMAMPTARPSTPTSQSMAIDYQRIEQSVREGSFQGFLRAFKQGGNLDNKAIFVQIDGEDVRAAIERRERNQGANLYRGLSTNGRH